MSFSDNGGEIHGFRKLGLHNTLASALVQMGKPGDALDLLQKSLQITDGTVLSLEGLKLRARAYVLLGRYWDAIRDLNRALEVNPGNESDHGDRAVGIRQPGTGCAGP